MPKTKPLAPLNLRMPRELLTAIEEARRQLLDERRGEIIGRSDVVRTLIGEALVARKIHVKTVA